MLCILVLSNYEKKRKNDGLYQLRVPKATNSDPAPISDSHQQSSLLIGIIADVSIIGKPIFLPEPFDMSRFTNSYPHCRGCHIGQRQTRIVKKQLNSVAAYKQQLTVFVPPVVPTTDHPITPSVSTESDTAHSVEDANDLILTPYVNDDSKPSSSAEDDDDTVATASGSSINDYPDDCNIQSVIFKPIIVCPGVLSPV